MAKKEKEVLETEAAETEANHAEPRVYELSFHIDPELSSDDAKKVYQAIRSVAGDIVAEGEPQKIQLAYTISRSETAGRHDFDASFFAWIAYEADGATHDKVIEAAKGDSRIFRFLDLRTDKEAARHSAEMHEIMAKAAKDQENVGEEVSEVELDNALKEVEV